MVGNAPNAAISLPIAGVQLSYGKHVTPPAVIAADTAVRIALI
jgi:hypothetical protein